MTDSMIKLAFLLGIIVGLGIVCVIACLITECIHRLFSSKCPECDARGSLYSYEDVASEDEVGMDRAGPMGPISKQVFCRACGKRISKRYTGFSYGKSDNR